MIFILRQSIPGNFQLLDAVDDGRVGELLSMILESSKVTADASADNSGEFLVSAQKSTKKFALTALKKRDGSHEQGESVLRKDRLPSVAFGGKLVGHFTHCRLVLLEAFQRSAINKPASIIFPVFFQAALKEGMVVAECWKRRVRASNLALALLRFPGEEDRSVVAEFQLETLSPGLAVLVQSIHSMMVDVDSVQAAASEAILVCVEGLEHLLEVMAPDDE